MTDPTPSHGSIDPAGGTPLDLDGDNAIDSLGFDSDQDGDVDLLVTRGASGSTTVVTGIGEARQVVMTDDDGDATIDRVYVVEKGVTYEVSADTGEILGAIDPAAVSVPRSATIPMPSSSITPSSDASATISMPSSSITPSSDASATIPMPSSSIIPSGDASQAHVTLPSPHIDVAPRDAPQLGPVEGSVFQPPTLTGSPVDLTTTQLWRLDLEAETAWRQITGMEVPRNDSGQPYHADYLWTYLQPYATTDFERAEFSTRAQMYQQTRAALI